MDFISISLTIVSILIAAFIAYKQNIQLKRSENISRETKSITKKLATDFYVQETAHKIFPITTDKNNGNYHYSIIYPVKYDGRPLPYINQGDFYAIHILSLAFGINSLSLIEIEPTENEIDDYLISGNNIFLCGPQSNPILNKFFPYATICRHDIDHKSLDKLKEKYLNFCNKDNEVRDWLRNEVGLPCWFINEYECLSGNHDNENEISLTKKIQVYDIDDYESVLDTPITSPAEECYRKARNRKERITCGRVHDYGIFARITKGENRFLILSGIHQYGTWIIAEYLNKLLRNKLKHTKCVDIFLSDKDFISIITGAYLSKTMTVEHCDIYAHKLWKNKYDRWTRYDRC